jgi:uncharacterized damage-inducible protein DinB
MLSNLLPAMRASQTVRERTIDLRPQMIAPLTQLLRQLGQVIESLDDLQYTQKPVGVIESSVGGHVRHCLDHVQSLLAAIKAGFLDYDHRQRGTPVETLRFAALELITELVDSLDNLPSFIFIRPLTVAVSMASDDEPVNVLSSVGREIAYVLAHTIHHNAIISAMVKTLGGEVPDRFGYAPSTIKNMEGRCARSASFARTTS